MAFTDHSAAERRGRVPHGPDNGPETRQLARSRLRAGYPATPPSGAARHRLQPAWALLRVRGSAARPRSDRLPHSFRAYQAELRPAPLMTSMHCSRRSLGQCRPAGASIRGIEPNALRTGIHPKLLRDLLDQFNATVPISVPQPGDLVFFANTYQPGIAMLAFTSERPTDHRTDNRPGRKSGVGVHRLLGRPLHRAHRIRT